MFEDSAAQPRATYRIQLHRNFDLGQAAALADYWAALGISHSYASPILQAVPGSMHGYDVLDHRKVNLELGGEESFGRFCQALSAILDAVQATGHLEQIVHEIPVQPGGGRHNDVVLPAILQLVEGEARAGAAIPRGLVSEFEKVMVQRG